MRRTSSSLTSLSTHEVPLSTSLEKANQGFHECSKYVCICSIFRPAKRSPCPSEAMVVGGMGLGKEGQDCDGHATIYYFLNLDLLYKKNGETSLFLIPFDVSVKPSDPACPEIHIGFLAPRTVRFKWINVENRCFSQSCQCLL